MKIGFDIDGVLTTTDYTHISVGGVNFLFDLMQKYFPTVLEFWFLKNTKCKDGIEIARQISQENEVFVITARPKELMEVTEKWLKTKGQIKCKSLYHVDLFDTAQKKLEIAKELGLDVFVDDTLKNVETMRAGGIKAIKFENWQQVLEELDKLK
jgi:uncharacterized HAD superfamily protein